MPDDLRFAGAWRARSLRRAAGLLALVSGVLLAGAMPGQVAAQAATAVADGGITLSGRLQPAGGYPGVQRGATLAPLPDGGWLLFGRGPLVVEDLDAAAQTRQLRSRHERPYPATVDAMGWRWVPPSAAWQRLPAPPDCPGPLRSLHTATALPDGQVLIAGGLCDGPRPADLPPPRRPHPALSLWDSRSAAWLPAPALQQARLRHSASLMADGSVWLVGGETDPALVAGEAESVLASVERFSGQTLQAMPPLAQARARHAAIALPDGGLIVLGGMGPQGEVLASVERWSAADGAWRRMPPLSASRHGHSATLLRDGRWLVAGGIGRDGRALASTELWDPLRGAWAPGPALPLPMHGQAVTQLGSGTVLLAGGARLTATAPRPWAWTWRPGSLDWQPAGRLRPAGAIDVEATAEPLALQALPDGGALVFTLAHILRWRPDRLPPERTPPLWSDKPLLAALPDGQLMAVGAVEDRPSDQPVVQRWDPRSGRWSALAALGPAVRLRAALQVMPDGQVLLLSVDSRQQLVCERLRVDEPVWQDCGRAALDLPQTVALQTGLLADGRAFVIASRDQVLVQEANAWLRWRSEWQSEGLALGTAVSQPQPLARILDPVSGRWHEVNDAAARHWQHVDVQAPRMLWDAAHQRWAYISLDRGADTLQAMGLDARLLDGGCALSMATLRLFSPLDGRLQALDDPGLGVEAGRADWRVLADGTLVLAGVPQGAKDAGAGFFHRPVGCAGFAPPAADDGPYFNPQGLRDAPAAATGAAGAAASAASAASSTPAAAAPVPPGQVAAARRWAGGLWQTSPAAVLGLGGLSLLALVLWRQQRPAAAGLVVLLLVGLTLWTLGRAPRTAAAQACAADPQACPLRGDPHKVDVRGRPVPATLPCRLIGLWTARQGTQARRVELRDDGRYLMARAPQSADPVNGWRGRWAVQDDQLLWLDDLPGSTLDANLILPGDADHFRLLEQNGSRTEFDRVEARPSTRCTP